MFLSADIKCVRFPNLPIDRLLKLLMSVQLCVLFRPILENVIVLGVNVTLADFNSIQRKISEQTGKKNTHHSRMPSRKSQTLPAVNIPEIRLKIITFNFALFKMIVSGYSAI